MPTTSRLTSQMASALLNKGFRQSNTHHSFFMFWVNGQKTSVRTRFSHGMAKYEKELLGKVKNQIHLNDWAQFDRFMDCPMTADEYLRLMISGGHVVPQASSQTKGEIPNKGSKRKKR